MLTTVRSGFQTGVDISAIHAARDCGLETIGFIPKGYKTLAGPKPEYKKLGAIEHPSTSYKERTWDNVLNSDGTLRFAQNFNSAGERCTYNAIKNHNKPHLDIYLDGLNNISGLYDVKDKSINRFLYEIHAINIIHDWIKNKSIQTLNVAGNSEQTAPGIYIHVYNFLMKVFDEYKTKRNDLVQKGSLVI